MRTAFCRAHGVASETEFKLRARDAGAITYHMHIGLTDWPATREALREIHARVPVERYGLCLDRAMGLPEADRAGVPKETGPRLSGDDWAELGEIVPIQPHLGDFMIGTPAGHENAVRALDAGITTIGNVGQYLAFDPPAGYDATEATVAALGTMAQRGGLVHSYLDDGPAMQLSHYGAYVGWAALELHIVEELLGARLAHCYGGLIPEPPHRAIVGFALDDLRGGDSVGSMIYGNTVDYTDDHVHNAAVLASYLLIDIGAQLRRPTGHAINPVPLTEAQRIPSAEEIVDVQLMARELEREARRSPALYDWRGLEEAGAQVAAYARRFRDRALDVLGVRDAAELLPALRECDPRELEAQVALDPPPEVAALKPWKAVRVGSLAERIADSTPRLDGMRIVLAVLEVHDLVRDALAVALPRAGAEVVLLPADVTPAQVAGAAIQEDADAVVVGTYNGAALSIARELRAEYSGRAFFGGLLNEDLGGPLPVDVRPQLEALGIVCVEEAERLGPLLRGD